MEEIHPRIALRVPGPWLSSDELGDALERAESGYTFAPGEEDQPQLVHIATHRRWNIDTSDHDDDLVKVFAGKPRPPTDDELDAIAQHAVKIHLTGAGGSEEDARATMHAATALIRAGGSGVLIDSSTAAHGPTDWLALSNDSHGGGLFWAYVVVGGSEEEIFSIGMHCLGFRDAEMPGPLDPQSAVFYIQNFLGYVTQSGRTVHDGDILGGEDPSYRAIHVPCTRFLPDAPFYNPYGIYRLEKIEE